MSEDIKVIEDYLSDKFKERFDYIKTGNRTGFFKSENYTIHLETSFINKLDLYKDDLISRLNSTFNEVTLDKKFEYVIKRNIYGNYVVLVYEEDKA